MHHMLVIIQALPAWPGSDSVCNACGSGDAVYMGVSIGRAPKQDVWFKRTIIYKYIFFVQVAMDVNNGIHLPEEKAYFIDVYFH